MTHINKLQETVAAIKWLHISDLHLKAADPFDHDLVLNALLRSFPGLVKRFGVPDFVIVTGDLSFSGKADEFARVTTFLDGLLSCAQLPKSRLFVIPGNHDVDRRGGIGLARSLTTASESDAYFAPAANLPHVRDKLNAFVEWHDRYFDGIRTFPRNRTYHIEQVEIGSRRGELTLFNSALFCQDNDDFGKLSLGRRQVMDAVEQSTAPPGTLRMAAMHHPFSWLNSVESPQVKAAIQDAFDCVLRGHLHENEAEAVAGSSGEVLHLAAGATYQGSRFPNTALICEANADRVIVTPLRFVESPRAAWSLDTGMYPEAPTYQGTYLLPRLARREDVTQANLETKHAASNLAPVGETLDTSSVSRAALEERLFTTPSGRPIYAEPRLYGHSQLAALSSEVAAPISLDEIVSGVDSFLIEGPAQYGASTFCRVLHLRFGEAGTGAALKNARDLPNYRKKLAEAFEPELRASSEPFVLILDDFDSERDDRLLRELHSFGWFSRIVIIAINRRLTDTLQIDTQTLPFAPRPAFLWTLDRGAIRALASTLLDANDVISVSRAVDKVYSDLLGLRIPLTPMNVIIYLRVLQREGDFEPLSRVDILSRYLSETLRKPSDVTNDSFNFKNKMDVLSAFADMLYRKQLSTFDELTWFQFCRDYQLETLSEFDAGIFFHEIVEARIFGRFGNTIFFRYSFYYVFFLGRYLWPRPARIAEMFSTDDYLVHSDVIEVITGLSSENAEVIRNLSDRLSGHIEEFARKYVKQNFDTLIEAVWPDDDKEGDQLWGPVQKAIGEGPADIKEIDELKTSMLAEARTSRQQVTFQRFTQLENVVFRESQMLVDALKNADDVSGAVKVAAWRMVLQVTLIIVQVGTMLAPALAERDVFRWGGMTFLDFNKATERFEQNSPEAFIAILIALVDAAAYKVAVEAGSLKLAPIFRAVCDEANPQGFIELANFACICAGRGRGWADTLTAMIQRTGKNAFYLRAMLEVLVRTLREEILQGKERDAVKRLVALIQAKRNWGREAPEAKTVTKMVKRLEEISYFPEPESEVKSASVSRL